MSAGHFLNVLLVLCSDLQKVFDTTDFRVFKKLVKYRTGAIARMWMKSNMERRHQRINDTVNS